MMHTEELISRLAAGLTPVRRLPPPGLQTIAWLAFAGLVLGLAVGLHGLRPDLAERMTRPHEALQLAASLATGVAAAYAAFQLARPDRPLAWALLPLPPLALWVGSLGAGCLADLARLGSQAFALGTSWGCLGFITLLSLPLSAGMLWAMRRADRLRPTPVLALGGLAAASLCSAGLSVSHHLDAALMVLLWHGGSVAMVVAASALFGRLGRG
jgi:hypothetical protein